MNIAQRIFKNTTALGFARLLMMGNSIILAWLIARTLGVTGMGVYSTVLAFFGVMLRWGELGISQFIPRDVSRDLSKTNRYVVHLGLLSIGITLIAMAVLYVIVPRFDYSAETTLGIYVISLALIPTSVNVIVNATIITHERVEFITYAQIVESLGNILGTVYLLINGYGVVAIIINFTIFRYVGLVVSGYFLVRHIIVPHWEFEFSFLKTLVGELKTFTLLGLLGGLFEHAEVLALSLLGNDADVGFYTSALKFVTVWYILPQSFMGVVFPIFSRSFEQSVDKFKQIQAKSVKYLMSVALPLGVGMMVVGDQIITIFYGPGFEKSVPVLRVLAWMPILFFLSGILWRTLLARNEQHLALRVQIISLVVRVVSAFLFISWFGYLGAAVALGATYAFYVFLHLYYVWKGGTPVPFFRVTWRFIVAALIMGVFSWFLSHWLGVHLLINVPLSALVYAGLVLLLQGFAQDDIELFRNVVQRRSKIPA